MTEFITRSDQVTSGWLTQVLGCSVVGFRSRANDAFNSSIVHLELDYGDEGGGLPGRLFLKLNAEGWGELEVGLYQLAAAERLDLPMLPTCYTSGYDSDTDASYLFLEDLSDMYVMPVTREQLIGGQGVPSERHLEQIVNALVAFHAAWWEHPHLGQGVAQVRGWYNDEAAFRAHIERREREWAAFTANVPDFPAELKALYKTALVRLPGLWEKYLQPRVTGCNNLTMSQGDCYLTQFLCPVKPDDTLAKLADFQEVGANFGAFDLVFLLATFWSPEQRHDGNREEAVLKQYHQILLANGVRGYTWENLVDDYRLMLFLMLFFPVFDQVSGASHDYWWPKMGNLVAAYGDWECDKLFQNI